MRSPHLRRPALIAAIAALFIVMPFIYPDGPGQVEVIPTPTQGADCTIEWRRGLGWESWYPVEVCE